MTPTSGQHPDDPPLEKLVAGDADALATLCLNWQDRVYTLALRIVQNRPDLAADATQETLLRVVRGLPSFDARAQLSTWITRITVNTSISVLRAEHKQRRAQAALLDSSGRHAELLPETRVEYEEEHAALLRALDQLSTEHRTMILLRDMQNLEYAEIAGVLDMPVGTVRSRLFRARAALRNAIESPDEPAGESKT